ncbi:MAG: pilus assembly protein [Actinobacteria bacterium]|nr:pilus assembly protein [Actinomycetota bacterium]
MTTVRKRSGGTAVRAPRGERRLDDERGVALVEFSLVVVMLCVLLYGIVAFGMTMALRQSMGQATGEAVRAAIVFPGTDAEKIAEAQNIALDTTDGLGKPGFSDIEAAIAGCTTGGGDCITVTYVYRYGEPGAAIIPPLPGLGLLLPNTLTATATGQIVPGP